MTCSDFIDNFSDYIDGLAAPDLQDRADAHLDGCPSCQRYREVFLEGRAVLRAQDEVEPTEDFRPRLQHRLYHVDDERALKRSRSSTVPATLLLGAAAVLAGVLTAPEWFEEPQVRLSPIVVDRPEPRPLGLRSRGVPALLPSVMRSSLELDGGDLWHQPSALLFEYAPVRERYRGVRAGLD